MTRAGYQPADAAFPRATAVLAQPVQSKRLSGVNTEQDGWWRVRPRTLPSVDDGLQSGAFLSLSLW